MRTIKLPFVVLVLGLWAAQAASADTLTVTSTDDDGPGTLRTALAAAADGDTINFALTTPATIQLTSGALVVDKSVTITGPGDDQLTVLGDYRDRVFLVIPPDPDWTLEKTVTISGLTIANGRSVQGGGIYQLRGTLTLRDCTLRDNFAGDAGGGVFVANGTLVITRCTLSDNTIGAVDENLYTGGAIAFLVQGEDGRDNFTTLAIENSLLTRNTALYGYGGAISILVEGGAFDHPGPAGATVTVTDSTLSGNVARGGYQALGGGIAIIAIGSENPLESWAHLTVENSTLGGNSAIGGSFSVGGGIAMYGQNTLSVIVKVLNSTLSGNWASSDWPSAPSEGGAIHAAGNGLLMVGNSTLSGNWVVGDASLAGGIFNFASEIFIWNTILNAGPSGANLYQYEDEGDPSYVHINSLGYNLSSDDGGGFLTDFTDQVNTDPLLGPLADNGGPTFTHALQADSPAIDMGSAFDMDMDGIRTDVATDQRGVSRPQGSGDDIGAFEAEFGEHCWSGVLPPVNPDGTSVFKARSTIPLKFMLIDCSAGITDLVATLSYAKVDNSVAGTVNESVSTAAATTGNQFRYDADTGQYVFNWSTRGLSSGTYQLSIDLGDGVTRTVNLDLR
jgi:hypothetical protein